MASTTSTTANMVSTLKSATALAIEIERLDKELSDKKRQLDEILLASQAPLNFVAAPTGSDDFDGGNKTRQILAFMKQNRGRPMQGADVAKVIGLTDVNIVRSLMNRLAGKGKLKKVSRGHFVFP